MVGSTPASGRKVICMASESISGVTSDSTKVNTLMIKNTGMESMSGLTVAYTKDIGKMVNNTD